MGKLVPVGILTKNPTLLSIVRKWWVVQSFRSVDDGEVYYAVIEHYDPVFEEDEKEIITLVSSSIEGLFKDEFVALSVFSGGVMRYPDGNEHLIPKYLQGTDGDGNLIGCPKSLEDIINDKCFINYGSMIPKDFDTNQTIETPGGSMSIVDFINENRINHSMEFYAYQENDERRPYYMITMPSKDTNNHNKDFIDLDLIIFNNPQSLVDYVLIYPTLDWFGDFSEKVISGIVLNGRAEVHGDGLNHLLPEYIHEYDSSGKLAGCGDSYYESVYVGN